MADKITESTVLGIGIEYTTASYDTDLTRYIEIPNPRSGLTETQIKTAMQNYLTGNVFLDKKTGDTLVGANVKTAYTERTKIIDYDIGFFD